MSNSNQIVDNILKSTSMIVQNYLRKANFDKTILATIVKCEDATIGKYKVKYQDGEWYAYSNNTDSSYADGASVYVLVPGGDMSRDKTILGTTDRLGINYVTSINQEKAIIPIGLNGITGDVVNFCSYHGNQQVILYDKSSDENLIAIDDNLVKYIRDANYLLVKYSILTDLNSEQKFNGIYGIQYDLDFTNKTTGQSITKSYVFDINSMEGNPYNFIDQTEQIKIFNIDNENFEGINKITAFINSFPITDLTVENDDIFLSDFYFGGADLLQGEDLSSYAIYLTAPQGYIFTQDDGDDTQKQIIANIKIKGQLVNNEAQSISYYWFVEDPSIVTTNPFYSNIGGKGWRCLNEYNETLSEDNLIQAVDFVPGTAVFTIKKSDILMDQIKYKCVAIYNNTSLENDIIVYNRDSSYNLNIISSKGKNFNFDVEQTNLIAELEPAQEGVQFNWYKRTRDGNLEAVPANTGIANQYITALNKYMQIRNGQQEDPQNEEYWDNAPSQDNPSKTNKEYLEELQSIIENCLVSTFVYGNTLYGVYGVKEDNYITYLVNVVAQGQSLAHAEIQLFNSLEKQQQYTLNINNGTQVFKYDTYGVSPLYSTNGFTIPSLSFDLYDEQGNRIEDSVVQYSDITWIVPAEKTMLRIPQGYEGQLSQDGTKINYKGHLLSFSYSIADNYEPENSNNIIQLSIVYNNIIVYAKTNLSFIKEGDNGTNGTEYSIKLVSANNLIDDNGFEIPTIEKINGVVDPIRNYNVNRSLFDVELWHNGNSIFKGYQSGTSIQNKSVRITWSVLKNNYTNTVRSNSDILSIDSQTGVITSNGTNIENTLVSKNYPVNIVQAKVEYDDLIYYAAAPVLMSVVSSINYRVRFRNNSGFRQVVFNQNGKLPEYSQGLPFEIGIFKKLSNGNEEDITSKFNFIYSWNYYGSVYNTVTNVWDSECYLIDHPILQNNIVNNKRWLKVLDGFDGLSTNQGVTIYASYENINVLLYIPIYMMINRYGHQNLNDWNGNSIEIDNNGGYILSPQMGAGVKHDDNTFTGIFMGKKRGNQNGERIRPDNDDIYQTNVRQDEQLGLFGYNHGQRSIFLDAETGKAQFGIENKAKIIIDPSVDTAVIRSGNYQGSNKTGIIVDHNGVSYGGQISNARGQLFSSMGTGMAINLSQGIYDEEQGPWIKYGNEKFHVDKDGNLIARDGTFKGNVQADSGRIGNCYIIDGILQIGGSNIDSDIMNQISNGNEAKTIIDQNQNDWNKINNVETYKMAIQYGSSIDRQVEPTSWQDTPPQWVDGLYIWQKTTTITSLGQEIVSKVCLTGQKGQSGSIGEALYTATLNLYKKSNTTPTKPTDTLKYTFATGQFTQGSLAGWSATFPAGDEICYILSKTIVSSDPYVLIQPADWIGPTKFVEKGTDINSITTYYYLGTSAPSGNPLTDPTNWSTTPQTYETGKKYYTASVIAYSDNTQVSSDPIEDKGLNQAIVDAERASQQAASANQWITENGIPSYQMLTNWAYNNAISSSTKINGGLIQTDTVLADAIYVDKLSALTADMGELTAGIIHSNGYQPANQSGTPITPNPNYHYSTQGMALNLNDNTFRTPNFAIESNGDTYIKGQVTADTLYVGGQDTVHLIIDNSGQSAPFAISNGTAIARYLAEEHIYFDGEKILMNTRNFNIDQNGNVILTGTVTAIAGVIGDCIIKDGILQIANANISEKLTIGQLDNSIVNNLQQGARADSKTQTLTFTSANGLVIGSNEEQNGYQIQIDNTGIKLKQNKTRVLSQLTGEALTFYKPGTSTVASSISSQGLVINEGRTGGFQLDSNSIRINESSHITDGSITLSSIDFTREIYGSEHTNLRFAIGKYFGVAKDGTVYASNGEFNGNLIAKTLRLGSQGITRLILTENGQNRIAGISNGDPYVERLNGQYIIFDGTKLSIQTKNFIAKADGDTTIRGKIYAEQGQIGKGNSSNVIHITNTALYSGNKDSYDSSENGFYFQTNGRFGLGNSSHYLRWNNSILDISGKIVLEQGSSIQISETDFKVTSDGTLTANKGKIGNINITDSAIYSGSHNSYSSSSQGFYLGQDGKFGIGDSNQYLRWDGSQLQLKVQSLTIKGTNAATTEDTNTAALTAKSYLYYDGTNGLIMARSIPSQISNLSGHNVQITANGIYLRNGTEKLNSIEDGKYTIYKKRNTGNNQYTYEKAMELNGTTLNFYSWINNSNQSVAEFGANGFIAKNGYIGSTSGFKIDSTAIRNTKTSYNESSYDGIYLGTAGIGLGKGVFYISKEGKGKIGKINVDTDKLYSGSRNTSTSNSKGFYLDEKGNFTVGDNKSFLKWNVGNDENSGTLNIQAASVTIKVDNVDKEVGTQEGVNNAAKTATNYLFDSGGLIIARNLNNSSTVTNKYNTYLTDSDINLRYGTTNLLTLSTTGMTIYRKALGSANPTTKAIEIGLTNQYSSGKGFLKFYNNSGTAVAEIGETGLIIDSNGEFKGKLSAATGTFAGSLSAATGSFQGTVKATDGQIGPFILNDKGFYDNADSEQFFSGGFIDKVYNQRIPDFISLNSSTETLEMNKSGWSNRQTFIGSLYKSRMTNGSIIKPGGFSFRTVGIGDYSSYYKYFYMDQNNIILAKRLYDATGSNFTTLLNINTGTGDITVTGNSTFSNNVTFSKPLICKGMTMKTNVNNAVFELNGSEAYLHYGASISSIKYKKVLKKMSSEDIEEVYNIQPVFAKYKEEVLDKKDERFNKYYPMFIAEDVDKYLSDAIDHDNNGQPKNWNHRVMIPVMFQMIKSQKESIDNLQNQNKQLETELNNLKSEIIKLKNMISKIIK